jgi:hypothetical protein
MAFLSEGFALQHGIFNGTPGLIVSAHTVPPSSDRGFEALAKGMDVQLKVDTAFWFAMIWAVAVTILAIKGRRRRLSRVKTDD